MRELTGFYFDCNLFDVFYNEYSVGRRLIQKKFVLLFLDVEEEMGITNNDCSKRSNLSHEHNWSIGQGLQIQLPEHAK